jgi:ubiquinone/menaquinone biosynthesis C-methylase UbiE
MEPDEYERMYRAENKHWWYLGMEAITDTFLKRLGSPEKNLNILDAGCGTGAAMSTYLAKYGKVTGIDISALALKFCRTRNLAPLALASVLEIPFQASSFDLVTSFDVLYERNVTSDVIAMNEFFRVLCPGGFILLRLPAYDWLRGQHDLTIHTARRYTVLQAAHLLKNSGFQILHLTYANTILFPLALAKRLLERLWRPVPSSSDLSVEVGAFNELFRQILSCEAPFVARMRLPFGLSVIALGRKPDNV